MKWLKGFTLIEIMLGILIFSMIMIVAFQALSSVSYGKIGLVQNTNIEKQSIYFSEKFFEMIKAWGTLDYEEYFNRKVVNMWGSTPIYSSGHYARGTWFWNYWVNGNLTNNYGGGYYYCISPNGSFMWTWWCVWDFNTWSLVIDSDYSWESQRYGQYKLQFIDYNSNYDSDWGLRWDEDGNWKIVWDDDDEFLWTGPSAFTWWTNIKELYLLSWDKKTRTLFRWSVKDDPNAPTSANCNFWNWSSPTWSWCLGTIEFLKLEWKDWGFDHVFNNSDIDWTEFDGNIDTWLIHNDFSPSWSVAGSNAQNHWIKLFPDSMNVSDFKVFAFPNSDVRYNWKDEQEEKNIAPYIRIQFNVEPSWGEKKDLKMKSKVVNFSTTISLTDIFSQ